MGALDLDTQFHFHDGKMTVARTQDCTAIAEEAKRKHNDGMFGSSEMKLAASIPFVFVEKYLNDNNITLSELMQNADHKKRLLTDPALDHFRIWKGKL